MFEFDMDFNGSDLPPGTGPSIPEASDCLRCGVCVNVCPTFKLFQHPEETPRNRIRTIANILHDKQTISVAARGHLDNCLQCRACETVCPSQMHYGELFGQAQAQLAKPARGWAKLGLWLVANKLWRSRLLPSLAWYWRSGLQAPLRRSGVWQKLGLAEAEALMQKPITQPLKPNYPCTAARRGQVALFSGCLAENFDRDTLMAAIRLLNAIGYDVRVPPQQSCCGAIHQHNGYAAAALIDNNVNVFNALDVDAVLHAATGCGAMLSGYPTADGGLFRQRLQDIHDFLLAHWPDNLQLAALPEKIAVHEPCSQRNVLKNTPAVYQLLAKIPGITVLPLADNATCCGAGGSYLLSHPDNAKRLRALKRQAIQSAQADAVASSNFTCAAFLSDGNAAIKHPLQWLAACLPENH